MKNLSFCENSKKKLGGGRGEGGEGLSWSGGQGGCDRRIEVFGKIHKKKKKIGRGEGGGFGQWGGGGVGLGGSGGMGCK